MLVKCLVMPTNQGFNSQNILSIYHESNYSFYPHFDPTRNSQISERPEQHKKLLEWTQNDKIYQNDHLPRFAIILTSFNHSWVILNHLRAIPSFLCFQTTTEWKLFSFEYHLTMISIFPLGPVWACPRVWMFLLHPEVRLGWARGTSLEWPF